MRYPRKLNFFPPCACKFCMRFLFVKWRNGHNLSSSGNAWKENEYESSRVRLGAVNQQKAQGFPWESGKIKIGRKEKVRQSQHNKRDPDAEEGTKKKRQKRKWLCSRTGAQYLSILPFHNLSHCKLEGIDDLQEHWHQYTQHKCEHLKALFMGLDDQERKPCKV